MEVTNMLRMNGGVGETSYANNSLLQRKVISMVRPIMEEAVTALYLGISSCPSTLMIADLGCSSGPNTFFAVSQLIGADKNHRKKMGHSDPPEYQVFLNDLPGNDFNAIFRALPLEQENPGSCFFTGVPGSFYNRLFPSKSLHFVHSSYSLHWLSQVPKGLEGNKGNIYIASSSPQSVIDAYFQQFQNDFSAFLRHRARELVSGGRMVLTILGRRSEDPSNGECCCIWELLAMALNEMVLEGLIEEGKLDTFNIPTYLPSPLEVEAEVQKEGSFSINRLEVSEVNWNGDNKRNVDEDHDYGSNNRDINLVHEEAYSVSRCMRAVAEPLLVSHFGPGIIEDVFGRYRLLINDRMAKQKTEFINVTVSLTRRPE